VNFTITTKEVIGQIAATEPLSISTVALYTQYQIANLAVGPFQPYRLFVNLPLRIFG
jgi:hypothetical protein